MKITIEGDEDECRAAAMALAMGFQERHCPRDYVPSTPQASGTTPGGPWYDAYPEGSRAELLVSYRTLQGSLIRAWTPVTVDQCINDVLYAKDDTGQGLGSGDASSWRPRP